MDYINVPFFLASLAFTSGYKEAILYKRFLRNTQAFSTTYNIVSFRLNSIINQTLLHSKLISILDYLF